MYIYENVKKEIMNVGGLKMVLKLHKRIINETQKYLTMGDLIKGLTGNSWHMMACVDLLSEYGELTEQNIGPVPGQNRLFKITV